MRNSRRQTEPKATTANSAIMKRPLTLDLNRKQNNANNPPVLSTPDVSMCKLASPDLENFILNNDTLQTPSSINPQASSNVFTPAKITSEQEDYAKGFEDALKNLQNSEIQPSTAPATSNSVTKVTTMSGGGITTYSDAETASLMLPQIKEEPTPASPPQPLNPIDMHDQERIKLERKRQRNRVAASKCRKRKLERISKLEDRVKLLKVENHELSSVLLNLKNHVFELKQQVIEHHNAGCHITIKN